jgi:pimeloyl-ACP methyl ester carboxylesterase
MAADATRTREPVVLVHGLWMIGHEFSVLRHRLQARHGYDVHVFTYPSLHGDAAEIGAELAEFARRCAAGADRAHVVGHSLGGAIAYRALEQGLRDVPGHTVVMAAPLNGCRAAYGATQFSMLRSLLGPHVLHELAEGCERCWPVEAPRKLGAIAGTRRLGIGQFFAHFEEDNDGTVAVSETVIPGLTDHLVLPHSHIGMLFANDVADQVAHFLRHGCFDREKKRGAEAPR